MEMGPDEVTPAEVRRRVQRAISQLRMVDADLAIIEARNADAESVASVARRMGRIETEIDVVTRKTRDG